MYLYNNTCAGLDCRSICAHVILQVRDARPDSSSAMITLAPWPYISYFRPLLLAFQLRYLDEAIISTLFRF